MTSGARTLRSGEAPVVFRFDMAFTPSKPLDLRRHWKSRYLQIGYGVGYTDPQTVSQMGVTVATLHQGIGGMHNASDGTPSMVNPYINCKLLTDIRSRLRMETHIRDAFRAICPRCCQFYGRLHQASARSRHSGQVLLHDSGANVSLVHSLIARSQS